MMIKYYDKERILKVCNHEAGHYIASKEMQFTTNGIKAFFNYPNGHSGESEVELWKSGLKSTNDLKSYIENRIIVLYVGVMAESMQINGQYDELYALNEWKKGGGMIDHAKIRELTHVLRKVLFTETSEKSIAQEELDSIDKLLFQKSFDFVKNHIGIIYQIGNLLFEKVTMYHVEYLLTEEEIYQIIN